MTIQSGSYSFLDVAVSLSGPGGSVDLSESGLAEEGIRITQVADKNTMLIGAAGDGMHSLRASTAVRVELSLLKTGTGNAVLNAMYRFQSTSSANWGQNTMTITNPNTGDSLTLTVGAFVKQTDLSYGAEGGLNAWPMEFIASEQILGDSYQTNSGNV